MAYSFAQNLSLGAGAATFTKTPLAAGNIWILTMWTSGGGGTPWTTSITDTQGNTWHTVFGTLGGTSEYFTVNSGNFFARQYWAKMSGTSSNTVTFAFNGGAPGTINIFGTEYSGLSAASPVSSIHNDQATPGTGANAVTTSGGTGSDVVNTVPSAIVGHAFTPTGTNMAWTAGTGFNGRYINANDIYATEDERATSSGTYDATFTVGTNQETVSIMAAWQEPPVGVPVVLMGQVCL